MIFNIRDKFKASLYTYQLLYGAQIINVKYIYKVVDIYNA